MHPPDLTPIKREVARLLLQEQEVGFRQRSLPFLISLKSITYTSLSHRPSVKKSRFPSVANL